MTKVLQNIVPGPTGLTEKYIYVLNIHTYVTRYKLWSNFHHGIVDSGLLCEANETCLFFICTAITHLSLSFFSVAGSGALKENVF